MGRMIYLLMGIVAINLGLMIFSCNTWDTTTGECAPSSSIWSFVLDPSLASTSSFWEIIFGSAFGLAAIGATIIFIGSFFLKVEFPLYAAMAVALSYPVYSWIKFFNHVAGAKLFADNPVVGTVAAIIIISPIIVTYVMTALDWARGRD